MKKKSKRLVPAFYAPPEIHALFVNRTLTLEEFYMAGMIDSLCRYSLEKKGFIWCVVSNKKFAERMGISESFASKILSRLKSLGVVRQVKFTGRIRYLETCWTTTHREEWNSRLAQNVQADSPKRAKRNIEKKIRESNTSYSLRNGRTELFSGDTSNEFDHSCAKKLHHTLLTTKKIYLGSKPKTWYKHFTTLRKHHSPEEISSVLDWFITHIKDQYTPHAYTAHHFVMKFDQIKKIMNFHNLKASVGCVQTQSYQLHHDKKPIKITPELQKLLDEVNNRYWPEQAIDPDVAILQSYQNADVFLDACYELCNKKSDIQHFAQHLSSHFQETTFPFIVDWFEWVHDQVEGWDKWSGHFKSFIFSFDNQHFQKKLYGWAKKYGGETEEKLQSFRNRIAGLMRKDPR